LKVTSLRLLGFLKLIYSVSKEYTNSSFFLSNFKLKTLKFGLAPDSNYGYGAIKPASFGSRKLISF